MRDNFLKIFNLYKHLRTMQTIVEEINTLDYFVYNFDEENAINLIDFCITKYGDYIKRIGSLYQNKVVIEDNPHIYEEKDEIEINEDVEYIQECLVIIGAVESGIRPSIQAVIKEISEWVSYGRIRRIIRTNAM